MNWLQGDMDVANGEATAARTSEEQKVMSSRTGCSKKFSYDCSASIRQPQFVRDVSCQGPESSAAH